MRDRLSELGDAIGRNRRAELQPLVIAASAHEMDHFPPCLHGGILRSMKKKLVVLALVLTSVVGVAVAGYLLYDHNEHKPLILECVITEAPAEPSRVSSRFILKFEASKFGWSSGSPPAAPHYWDFEKEDWRGADLYEIAIPFEPYETLHWDKSEISWNEKRMWPPGRLKVKMDRINGDFSETFIMHSDTGPSDDGSVEVRGSCSKSGEPAKTLTQKQKF